MSFFPAIFNKSLKMMSMNDYFSKHVLVINRTQDEKCFTSKSNLKNY